jgi:hypothetical protein
MGFRRLAATTVSPPSRLARVLVGALLLVVALSARADAYLDALIAQARDLRLAESPEWRALLHYQPRLGVLPSRALPDSPNFFLSPRGKTDAAAELEATVAAFFSDERETDTTQNPQCRFRARFAWLDARLGFDGDRLPRRTCPRFEQWRRALDPGRVTLVFASAYLNSPSSAYGHTLLRVDPSDGGAGTNLLSYAINFAARTDGSNALLYAARGLMGGYVGAFAMMPYYAKVAEYSDIENRDVWEYELTLDATEIDRLLAHVWEMGPVEFDYFFLDENCAYHLLAMLEVARPGLRLTSSFPLYAIPADTVKTVMRTQGLVRTVAWRPARGTVLRHRLRVTSPAVVAAADGLASGAIPVAEASARLPEEAARADALEIGYELLDYRRLRGDAVGTGLNLRLRELLAARAKVDGPPAPEPPRPTVRPDEGHGSLRLSLGGGTAAGHGFQELRLRFAYHDLMDPEPGFLRGGQIDFLGLGLRHDNDTGQLAFDRFTLAEVVSLTPRDPLLPAWSWRGGVGIERTTIGPHGRRLPVAYAKMGAGVAIETARGWLLYAFAEGDLRASGHVDRGYAAGPAVRAGTYIDVTPDWRVHPYAMVGQRIVGATGVFSDFGVEQRLTLTKRAAVTLEARRRVDFGVRENRVAAFVHLYF